MTKPNTKTKPVVKYHKNKKTGISYKRTLLLTLEGQIAEKMSKCDLSLYWCYDAKRKKLEIYEDKMITPPEESDKIK